MDGSIRFSTLWGEAGSVSVAAVASEMVKIRNQLQQFSLHCIFKVDETELFYKFLRRRTYFTERQAAK